jgi:3'-5' exoribonuclease
MRPYDAIDQILMVRDRQFGSTKAGQPFAKLTLGDATGNIAGMYWDVNDAAKAVLEQTKYVNVRGTVGTYNNSPQLTVQTLDAAPADKVVVTDFLPSTDKDVAVMFKRLKVIMATVKSDYLVKLITAIFTDKELCDKVKRAPAAAQMHHAYVGGLLEHTLSMAEAALKLCEHYSALNRDLLLVGCLTHDIGKVDEFVYESSIEYSDAGRLVGHIAIGMRIVEEKAAGVEGFPKELLDLLRHYILSHHGVPEFGAIRAPMTAEALALHHIDNLDAKLAAFWKATLEHPVAGDSWTAYQKMFEGFLYRKDVFAQNGKPAANGSEEPAGGKPPGPTLF